MARAGPSWTGSQTTQPAAGSTVHHRHGRLDGVWNDVLVVERLLDST